MAADMREEYTFSSFSTRLLSFTALPCEHDENNPLPDVCNCRSLDATVREMPVVEVVFQVSLPPEKIHGLQTDSVMIAPPDTGCFPISQDQARALNSAHGDFTYKQAEERASMLGAETSKL